MTETRVIPAIKEEVRTAHSSFIPVSKKFAGVLALALIPPLAVALWLRIQFPVEMTAPLFSFGSVTVSIYDLLIVPLTLVAFLIVEFGLQTLVLRPLTTISSWISLARAGRAPLLPALPNDEFGRLGRDVSSLVASLARMKKDNADLAEEKSLFTTIMAHQLRTPLSGLIWSIEALLEPTMTDADRQKMLPDVATLLKRMRLIVNHILATADVDSDQFGFVMKPFNIVPTIERLIEEFKPVIDDHSLVLRFEHPEDLPDVYADEERISIALFDLLSNAIDYTPSGGTITVSLNPSGTRVGVVVADTGIGIPQNELPLLFTRFYRGANARRVRPDGSGLGLYLVKNIIASHGSEIVVQSDDHGGGSQFSFWLSTQKPSSS